MVLILPVVCLVLVQVTMVIRNVFQLSSIAKQRSQASLQIGKFERMLRHDAHQSTRARWVEKTSSHSAALRMDGIDGRLVEYRIKKNGLVRIATTDRGTRSIEDFELFDAMKVVVEIEESDLPSIVVSLYRVIPGSTDRGRLELRIESAIGRHRRLVANSNTNHRMGQEQLRAGDD
ncbi:MAG: hypothetical protein ABL921_26850 [Pirellula sp.]